MNKLIVGKTEPKGLERSNLKSLFVDEMKPVANLGKQRPIRVTQCLQSRATYPLFADITAKLRN